MSKIKPKSGDATDSSEFAGSVCTVCNGTGKISDIVFGSEVRKEIVDCFCKLNVKHDWRVPKTGDKL